MWRGHLVVNMYTRQSLCRKGPFIISTGGGAVEYGVGHDFFDKLKGVSKFCCCCCCFFFFFFFVLKSGFYVPNHVFLNDLV